MLDDSTLVEIDAARCRAENFIPTPLPDSLPAVPEFESELLPSVLSVSALEISESKQAPIDFAAVSLMTALSSLLARHVAIRPMARSKWTEVPNLWGLIIGRPAAKKSPTMSESLRPLCRIEDKAAEDYKNAANEFEMDKELHAFQSKANQAEIQKLLKRRTPEAKSDAAALIQEQQDTAPTEPGCTRYIANDTTVEKLADLLSVNPGMLVCRDELSGFFANLQRHGQEGARAFYLEAWSGRDAFKVDRISRPSVNIPRVCVSVLGGIQPGPIGALMREAQNQSRANDGMMQRFQLAVWPDLSKTFELIDVEPDLDNWRDLMFLFERFGELSPESVGAEFPEDGMPYLRFDADAQTVFYEWLTNHETRLRSDEIPECLESHLGKYQSMVPSIALILHIAEGNTGAIGVESVAKAIAWSRYLEGHAIRIYAPVIGSDFVAAKALSKKILAGKLPDRFGLREVYRHGWSNLSREETSIAAGVLEDFNWIRRTEEPGEGRTGIVYQVNPLVWDN